MIASGGDLPTGFIGALTAGAFAGLHGWQPNGFSLGKVFAHGMVGGVSTKLQGGKFGAGFLSAGFTQALSQTPFFDKVGGDPTTGVGRVKNAAAAAVVGGTASVIGGGKFSNGAVTGAFSRMFNDLRVTGEINAFNEKYSTILDQGVNINENIKLAQSMSLSDFIKINLPGQAWDFKSLNSMSGINPALLEEFGNVHFGIMAAARGYSLGFTLVGAGTVQTFIQDNTPMSGGILRLWSPAPIILPNSVNRFLVNSGYPYGDNFGDSKKITSGFDYYGNSLNGK